MKVGAGKNKGSTFEREICRILTRWINHGKNKPELFWRTPSSGGKATQDMKKGAVSKMGGDIMAIDEKGKWFTDNFYIECKFYKDFEFERMLEGRGLILHWWYITEEKAKKPQKWPLLIFKRNYFPIYVMYSRDLEYKLQNIMGVNKGYWSFRLRRRTSFIGSYSVYIVRLKDFLEFIDPDALQYYLVGKGKEE